MISRIQYFSPMLIICMRFSMQTHIFWPPVLFSSKSIIKLFHGEKLISILKFVNILDASGLGWAALGSNTDLGFATLTCSLDLSFNSSPDQDHLPTQVSQSLITNTPSHSKRNTRIEGVGIHMYIDLQMYMYQKFYVYMYQVLVVLQGSLRYMQTLSLPMQTCKL